MLCFTVIKMNKVFLRDLAAILKMLIRSGYEKIRKLYYNYVKHIESKCKTGIRAEGLWKFFSLLFSTFPVTLVI